MSENVIGGKQIHPADRLLSGSNIVCKEDHNEITHGACAADIKETASALDLRLFSLV
jgi:hypothetical protein